MSPRLSQVLLRVGKSRIFSIALTVAFFGCPFASLAVAADVPAAQPATAPSDYGRLLDEIKGELHSGEFQQALATGTRAMNLDEKRFEAYSLSAVALIR